MILWIFMGFLPLLVFSLFRICFEIYHTAVTGNHLFGFFGMIRAKNLLAFFHLTIPYNWTMHIFFFIGFMATPYKSIDVYLFVGSILFVQFNFFWVCIRPKSHRYDEYRRSMWFFFGVRFKYCFDFPRKKRPKLYKRYNIVGALIAAHAHNHHANIMHIK